MGLFNKSKDNTYAFFRKGEEAHYQKALDEFESGEVNKGVYARAVADSLGDAEKTQSLYLRYRVQSIADERTIEVIQQKERSKEERWDVVKSIFGIIFICLAWLYLKD